MKKGGLSRKTAHSLRVTCSSTLFNKGFDQKLIRDRTGHTSDAVFGCEKISKEIMVNVSDALNPPLQSYLSNKRELEVQGKRGKRWKKKKRKKVESSSFGSGCVVFNDCNVTFNLK